MPQMANNPHSRTSRVFKKVMHGLRLFGIDVERFSSIKYLPRYFADRRAFQKAGGVVTHTHPVFDEYAEQAGSATGHYFHQDLLVASFIHAENPSKHIDVGSRIDGFVAHVASFREIEVIDVRPLKDTGHKNILFMRADLMSDQNGIEAITDSISCLHALEHFGLGRYGDPIDPEGHIKGFKNLCKMLKPGGTMYISFPIGLRNMVYFNAHRVFHPMEILRWTDGHLDLLRFDFVDDSGSLHRNWPIGETLPEVTKGCGIYTLRKQ